MRPFLLSFSLLILAGNARACLNDRDSDSLATQAAKFPDTLRVITGRFERNPPLYYQLRIRRSLAQLKQNPRQFGLYDDIAVAFDHLHRDDEALQIMAKKRALLPPFDAKDLKMKEAWYRYFANAGTFRAHRWLGAGAKVQTIGEMKQARDFIKRAIQIKPNAHFGREKYQLMTMDWILAAKSGKTTQTLGTWLADEDHDGWGSRDENLAKAQAATQGLSGLIVLGAAWESPDIFEALAASLGNKDGITLSYLALLRCGEILRNGKVSQILATLNTAYVNETLNELTSGMIANAGVNDKNKKALDELYPKLRTEAETWNKDRQAYMLARLEKGQHPDWDTHFWDEWNPAPPPSLDVPWFNESKNSYESFYSDNALVIKALLILFGAVGASLWGLRLVAKSRLAKSRLH